MMDRFHVRVIHNSSALYGVVSAVLTLIIGYGNGFYFSLVVMTNVQLGCR